MFHHITDEKVEASPECICSITNFVKVLEYLNTNAIKVVSIDEAVDNIKNKIFKGYAVITFDDGIEDTFRVAYPILKKKKLPFTVYITLSYLNKKNYLSNEQLNILSKEPLCTLGSHTLNHPVLRTCEYAKEEIVRSKQILENIIEKQVHHFAYPYGAVRAVSIYNIIQTKNARYHSAVSSIESRLNYFSTLNKLYLPRINVGYLSSLTKKT
jgi:peptidoglycan/xylan/chitin deacetylase (PgdA/CDA1 family)